MREVLACAPRPLVEIQAELLFLEGQYLLHWRSPSPENNESNGGGGSGAEHFKFLAAEQLRYAFRFQSVDSQWLPPGTLRWGIGSQGSWMVKLLRPACYAIELEVSKKVTTGEVRPDLSTVTTSGSTDEWQKARAVFQIPLPALVFGGIGHRYYVWAVKKINWWREQEGAKGLNAAGGGENVGNPHATLYHAPLPNVGSNGLICFGSNQPPTMAGEDGKLAGQILEEAWRVFIQSPFNDHLKEGNSKAQPGDVRVKLMELARATDVYGNQPSKYPLADLVPIAETYSPRAGRRRKKTLADAVAEHFAHANQHQQQEGDH